VDPRTNIPLWVKGFGGCAQLVFLQVSSLAGHCRYRRRDAVAKTSTFDLEARFHLKKKKVVGASSQVAACVAAELLCYAVDATAEWYGRRLLSSCFKKKRMIWGSDVPAAAADDAAELSNWHATVAVTAGVT
jgi:hypothetical protein